MSVMKSGGSSFESERFSVSIADHLIIRIFARLHVLVDDGLNIGVESGLLWVFEVSVVPERTLEFRPP